MDAFHHGRYLATVNISDIAAMGGIPSGLLVTLALPEDFSLAYLSEMYDGLVSGCSEWGIGVIGGDLGWGSAPCFSATSVGRVESGHALTRTGASDGDLIFVSGAIGGFNTALLYFIVAKPRGMTLSSDHEEYLRTKLIRPRARVDVGRWLVESRRCTSCQDITDGVGRTLFELSTASQVGLEIDERDLPLHPATHLVAKFLELDTPEIVFGIGLDLELAGTLRPTGASHQGDPVHIIGKVTQATARVLRRSDGSAAQLPEGGWQHFVGAAMDLVRKRFS
jgi:thiamine-monophosphate kinase